MEESRGRERNEQREKKLKFDIRATIENKVCVKSKRVREGNVKVRQGGKRTRGMRDSGGREEEKDEVHELHTKQGREENRKEREEKQGRLRCY